MPKWLQEMFAPTLMLWLYVFVLGVGAMISPEGELAGRADYVSRTALGFIMAWWVSADAHKRQRKLYYDYDSFVFFAWPIVVPVYLFQTRGVRAFLTLLCFVGIWLIVMLAALVVILIREFVFS